MSGVTFMSSRRAPLLRVWQSLVLWHLRRELECIESERDMYEAAGWVGPAYIINCEHQAAVLRVRIAIWEAK